jgi:hypothetical protein
MSTNDGFSFCYGSQNDTITDCPINDKFNISGQPVLVAAYNPTAQNFSGNLRVQVPNIFHEAPFEAWRALVWNGTDFAPTESHLTVNDIAMNNGTFEESRILYISANISAFSNAYVQIIGGLGAEKPIQEAKNTSLSCLGLSADNQTVIF